MNGISFKTNTQNIYAAKDKPKEEFIPLSRAKLSSSHARSEIKLLGLTFDEAQPIIDEAIDEAIVAGIHSLRIVHGKGTGALRTKVRDYLGRKKQVISISTPPPALGGSGVTIANV
jgi:DNA mismatch repair protein MutS2